MPKSPEHRPDDQVDMPTVHNCETFEDFKALTEQWYTEGFKFTRNVPNEDLERTVSEYLHSPEVDEVRLSSAFTQASVENKYTGQPLPDHTSFFWKGVLGRTSK